MAYLHLENSDTPVHVEDRDLPYLAGRRWFLRDGDVVGEEGVRAIDVILEERGGRLRTLDPFDLRRQNLVIDRGVSYVAARGLWRAGVRYGETTFLALAQVKHKEADASLSQATIAPEAPPMVGGTHRGVELGETRCPRT